MIQHNLTSVLDYFCPCGITLCVKVVKKTWFKWAESEFGYWKFVSQQFWKLGLHDTQYTTADSFSKSPTQLFINLLLVHSCVTSYFLCVSGSSRVRTFRSDSESISSLQLLVPSVAYTVQRTIWTSRVHTRKALPVGLNIWNRDMGRHVRFDKTLKNAGVYSESGTYLCMFIHTWCQREELWV